MQNKLFHLWRKVIGRMQKKQQVKQEQNLFMILFNGDIYLQLVTELLLQNINSLSKE